jgi:hypothetical protein
LSFDRWKRRVFTVSFLYCILDKSVGRQGLEEETVVMFFDGVEPEGVDLTIIMPSYDSKCTPNGLFRVTP